jgi:hypothetical protein
MRNLRRFGAVVLVMAFVALPAWPQAGKKKDAPLPSDKPDGSKLAAGKYAGVLKSTPNSDRMFDVEMPAPGGKKVVVEFQMAENAKVRTMLLPETFDSKGNPKKYTPKELAELKGKDRTLPGYESSVEGLAAGQTVTLTLAAVSKTPAPAGKKKEDDDAPKASVEKARQVRLVVITSAPEGSEGGGPRTKK